MAATHGDEVVVSAFKKVGPRAGRIASEAGEHGGIALKIMAKHGDGALVLAVSKKSLSKVAKYGDDAATALIRHGSVGEKLIDGFGKEGVQALVRVTPQNGRRLAMLAADGTLKPDLMAVVAKHGDRACDFVWRNKGALSIGAGLTAFVTAPEEFLDGTRGLAEIVGDAAIKPLASVPGVVAGEAAKRVNWNLVVFLVAAVMGFLASRWGCVGRSLSRVAAGLTQSRKHGEASHDA